MLFHPELYGLCHSTILAAYFEVEQAVAVDEVDSRRLTFQMDIIANAVTRYIQGKCSALADLWKAPFVQVEETLTQVG